MGEGGEWLGCGGYLWLKVVKIGKPSSSFSDQVQRQVPKWQEGRQDPLQAPSDLVFRGNHPATVDAQGRLKVPAAFLDALKQFGTQVFITSLDGGQCISIYPMPVWEEIDPG